MILAMRWTWREYRSQPRWYIDAIFRRLKEAREAEAKHLKEMGGHIARR